MQRPRGAARSPRRSLRPARVALALVVVLTATGLQASSQASDGSAVGPLAAITLEPLADATVSASRPDANFGRDGKLQVKGKPRLDSYLRFRVPAATGRAVLRLWVLDPTKNGPSIRRSDAPLDEAAVNWNNRTRRVLGIPVDSGPLKAGSWAQWDVSRLVTGPGDITLTAVADSIDGVEFGSRESDHSPQLVVTPDPTSPTTSMTTSTTTSTAPSTTPVPGTWPECRSGWAPAKPMAQLRDGLGEMSAFVASPNHRSWGWGIRDSGKPASLYAIKPAADGRVRTHEFRADGLRNLDWEDMAWTPGAEPGTGHLWVLENVGNGWTGDRWIYQFEEVDPENPPPPPPIMTAAVAATPTAVPGRGAAPVPPLEPTTTTTTEPTTTTTTPTTTTTKPTTTTTVPTTATTVPTTTTTAPPPPGPPPSPATLVGAYQWAYPDVQVNTETLFVFDGDLVVVTKSEPSRVYRFAGPLRPLVVNVPTYVGTLPAGKRLSVAAISADQRTLAVSNHGQLDVYVNRGDVRDLTALISNHVFGQNMPADNREGGSFFPYGSCDLLLVAESKTIWRLEHR